MQVNIEQKHVVMAGSSVIAVLAGYGLLDPSKVEPLTKLLSDTAQSSIAQTGFYFIVAAWIHSGRLKREIKSNFSSLTLAITEATTALKKEIELQGKLIGQQGEILANTIGRVETLESVTVTVSTKQQERG